MDNIVNNIKLTNAYLKTATESKASDAQSLEVVASAFEKMVFEQVFSFAPIINEQDKKLGFSGSNSLLNDLYKQQLHKQTQGSLLQSFLKDLGQNQWDEK